MVCLDAIIMNDTSSPHNAWIHTVITSNGSSPIQIAICTSKVATNVYSQLGNFHSWNSK